MRRILFIFLLAIIFLIPLIIIGIYSISSMWKFPEIIPESFSLRPILYVIDQKNNIVIALFYSFLYSIITVFTTILITIYPAQLFARNNFKGKIIIESLLITPALLPPMAFAMGSHLIFLLTGLSDSFIGIVLVLSTISYPYMLRALTAGFMTYSENYNVCAKNLGSNFINTLITIELPMLLPSIISGGTMVFLVAFSEYFLIFLIGGGNVPSYSGYLFPFLNSSDHSIASILTLIFLIIPFILFIILEFILKKYYRKRYILN